MRDGPDFLWAATGPALEAFSRHPVVFREASASGQREMMPVADFLREVRRLVVEFAVGRVLKASEVSDDGQRTGLDDITTYYVLHRDSFGMEDAPIGACILYAMSCGLSDADLADRFEILARTGGKAAVETPDDDQEEEVEDDESADTEQNEGTGSKVRLRRWDQRKRKTLGLEGIGGRTASVWGDMPPPGIVSKTAVLRTPPHPIDVSSFTPESLPDAWSGNKATGHSIEQAVAAQRGVVTLPWNLVESAITGAMNSGFLRLIPGAVSWPCQFHEAAAVEFGLPDAAGVGSGGSKTSGMHEPAVVSPKAIFRSAVLDSSQMTELVEAMGDVLAAAGSVTLRFRVAVEFAEGEVATPEIAAKLASALKKATDGFG
jgi:hypothetical protein